jgi:hypothetical protein
MAKKRNRTRKDKTEINRVRKTTGATHKTNTRKVRAAAEAKPKVTAVRLKVEQNQLVGVFGEIGIQVNALKGA